MGQFEAFVGVNFWTALFILLNTLTIFFVGKKYLFGPVTKIIEDRKKEIDDMYAQADAAKASADSMEAEYKTRLAAAQETSDALVKEAMTRGKNREEEIIRQAWELGVRKYVTELWDVGKEDWMQDLYTARQMMGDLLDRRAEGKE